MPSRHRRGDGSFYRDRTNKRWVAKYRSHKVYAQPNTEDGAKASLEDLRRQYGRADYEPAKGTLDDYLRDWLATLQGVEPSTKVSYAGHINLHISPLLGSIPVAQLRPIDVRRLVADRIAAGLSASTVRRIHSTLHAALAQGVRERTLTDNAAHGVTLPKVEENLVEAMTETDADAIRAAVRGTFLETLVELLLGSGLRVGEALGLDQGDVKGQVVMVRRTKGRKRAVAISADAAEALAAHIAAAKVRGAHEPVFLAPRSGGRLRGTTVSHAFPKMLLNAGLARLNPHGTRHGVATMLLAKGAPMKFVSEQLGHRSITTTDRYYAHVAPEHLQETVGLLNRRKVNP
jgi:site-specific recombinase XerD